MHILRNGRGGRGGLVGCYHLLHRGRKGQVKCYVTDVMKESTGTFYFWWVGGGVDRPLHNTLGGSTRVLSFLTWGEGGSKINNFGVT